MFGLFLWLRNKVKESVLAGIGDALAEVDGQTDEGTTAAAQALRLRLMPALTHQPEEETEAPTRNGKRVKA